MSQDFFATLTVTAIMALVSNSLSLSGQGSWRSLLSSLLKRVQHVGQYLLSRSDGVGGAEHVS